MNQQQHDQLLDLIYGAAAQPGLWVTVMETLADLTGGNSAWLSQLSSQDGSGSGVIARIDPVMPQRYIDYYGGVNPFVIKPRAREAIARWRPNITTEHDIFEPGALVRTEYYNDFLRPQDVHSVLMIDIAAHGVEVASVNINRSGKAGAFGREDLRIAEAMHGHLIRAFRLSGVFAGLKSLNQDMAASLDGARHGVFILDADGRLKHANRLGERMLAEKRHLGLVAGRLTALGSESARTLAALIGAAGRPAEGARRGGTMTMGAAAILPVSVTVAPLHAETLPIFTTGPSVLVCATDLRAELSVAGDRLVEVFGLTTAQARVAALLLEGGKPRDMAQALGVSIATVRTHLAAIYEKTSTRGQADLSRLLMRLTGNALQ